MDVPRAAPTHRAGCIGEQGLLRARQAAVLAQKTSLAGNADQRADRIEQIEKEEYKDNPDYAGILKQARKVEMKRSRRD